MVKNKIVKVLKDLGIPANLLGYEYLKTAIAVVHSDKNILRGITKELYPKVAKIHSTTPSRVERAIRHAICYSMKMANKETIEKYFGNCASKKAPTNGCFISVVAEYIMMSE